MNQVRDYSIRCDCGQVLFVQPSQAGGERRCACGELVKVPRLSELRRLAGETPPHVSATEIVRHMLAAGQASPGELCAYSRQRADDLMYFSVVCSVPYSEPVPRGFWMGLLDAFGSPIAALRPSALAAAVTDPGVSIGHENIFRLPLRVAAEHQPMVKQLEEHDWINLLATVPLYARLFQEHPGLRVSVSS